MDYLDLPLNKQDQYAKIIEDTEEIIRNFREISELMATRLEKTESSMFTLGKRVLHEHREFPGTPDSLGINQISLF